MAAISIDEEFQMLIIKYGIGNCYYKFATKLKCIELLNQRLIEIQSRKKRIILVSDNNNELQYVSSLIDESVNYQLLFVNSRDNANILKKECSDLSYILNISYYHKNRIQNILYCTGLKAVSLYDFLEVNGIELEGNFYDIFQGNYYNFHSGKESRDYADMDLNAIFFYQRRKYEKEEDVILKQLYLQKIIFICCFSRDFILLKKYIAEYVNCKYEHYDRYADFWKETEELLENIRKRVKNRTEDIIFFWLDALEYGDDSTMPFLKNLDSQAMVFDEAFTVTPFTQASAKNLFCSSKVIDDHSYRITNINRETSSLIRRLEENGYEFRYYGILKTMDKVRSKEIITFYTPASLIYWYAIRDILHNDRKMFCVLHEILHTHQPYISMGLTGEEYSFRERTLECPEEEKRIQERQILQSREYVDRQIEFYNGFLSEDTYKIFASDHGHTQYGRYHTIMKILQKNIKPCRVETLFSYLDFDKLISYLLKWDTLTIKDLEREYVEIQDIDYYFGPFLQSIIKQRSHISEYCFGYRGVITKNEIYIKYKNNRSYLLKRDKSEGIIERGRIEYLDKIAGNYSIDVYNDEKFLYSRYIYMVYENYLKRNKERDEKIKKTLNEILERLGKEGTIALRGGGSHSFMLLHDLTWEHRNQIKYIIDNNKDCLSSSFGIPIIGLEEIKNKHISNVIISSYVYNMEWKDELRGKFDNIRIIDLYEQFRIYGINFNREYYQMEYICSDFDVNFPEEVYNEKV